MNKSFISPEGNDVAVFYPLSLRFGTVCDKKSPETQKSWFKDGASADLFSLHGLEFDILKLLKISLLFCAAD